MVARERLPVERGYVRERGGGRSPRGATVGARERLLMGQEDVRLGGEAWRPRDAAVVARENGCPWGVGFSGGFRSGREAESCEWAAKGGHLEVLQ